MTDDVRALTGRSAVFGRLSSIVKSFHARTEIALARLATQKPEYPYYRDARPVEYRAAIPQGKCL